MKVRRGTANEAILKADRALFAQMIKTRELSMSTVLSHPLGPLPWTLATDDGSLRKNKKSSLAKDLQKDVPAAELILPSSACIIDGMALAQRLKGDGNTFAEIADTLMAMVLREGASSKQIDVVFDVYRQTSIKNTERERRGCQAGNEYRNLQPDHRVRQWRKFLSNPQNKKQLIGFINEEWKKEKFRQRLNGITLLVTSEETCTEICEDGVRPREDLRLTQKEVDTRLLLHA